MTRLVLVRHGQASARWNEEHDPGLDDTGRHQAATVADSLPFTPAFLVTSPLRRARETAAAIEARWGVPARIEPSVGEIPSPVDDLDGRGRWLSDEVLSKRWSDLGSMLTAWRRRLLECLVALDDGTVVVTHYVAINAAVGAATGDDRVVCCRPANCGVTAFEIDAGALRLVGQGDQAHETRVL